MVGGDHGHPGLIYRTLVGAAAAALPPERHSTVIGINPAGLAQPPPCAAFCDNSSPTRAACSGGAQQPCPPIPVFITRGSGTVRALSSTAALQALAAEEPQSCLSQT